MTAPRSPSSSGDARPDGSITVTDCGGFQTLGGVLAEVLLYRVRLQPLNVECAFFKVIWVS